MICRKNALLLCRNLLGNKHLIYTYVHTWSRTYRGIYRLFHTLKLVVVENDMCNNLILSVPLWQHIPKEIPCVIYWWYGLDFHLTESWVNLIWQILLDCVVASLTSLKWNTPIAGFPIVILAFQYSIPCFLAVLDRKGTPQCWRKEEECQLKTSSSCF